MNIKDNPLVEIRKKSKDIDLIKNHIIFIDSLNPKNQQMINSAIRWATIKGDIDFYKELYNKSDQIKNPIRTIQLALEYNKKEILQLHKDSIKYFDPKIYKYALIGSDLEIIDNFLERGHASFMYSLIKYVNLVYPKEPKIIERIKPLLTKKEKITLAMNALVNCSFKDALNLAKLIDYNFDFEPVEMPHIFSATTDKLAKKGKTDVLDFLLTKMPPKNSRTSNHYLVANLIVLAAKNNKTDTVESLLKTFNQYRDSEECPTPDELRLDKSRTDIRLHKKIETIYNLNKLKKIKLAVQDQYESKEVKIKNKVM